MWQILYENSDVCDLLKFNKRQITFSYLIAVEAQSFKFRKSNVGFIENMLIKLITLKNQA